MVVINNCQYCGNETPIISFHQKPLISNKNNIKQSLVKLLRYLGNLLDPNFDKTLVGCQVVCGKNNCDLDSGIHYRPTAVESQKATFEVWNTPMYRVHPDLEKQLNVEETIPTKYVKQQFNERIQQLKDKIEKEQEEQELNKRPDKRQL